MMELRLRNTISAEELEQKVGKIVTDHDYNLLLTGPCRVWKPDGTLLCVSMPGALSEEAIERAYKGLHHARTYVTDNRGLASGSRRVRRPGDNRTRSVRVASCAMGAFEGGGSTPFCRLSSWTVRNPEEWESMQPLLHEIAEAFKEGAPKRYEAQMRECARTKPGWVVPGTPFTSITINNTYPTGVHKDKGDSADGFSCLAVMKYGLVQGGTLVLPLYRLGVDLNHGDVLLMDAHEFHGNTMMQAERPMIHDERISVVAYFRTGVLGCGTFDEELEKSRKQYADVRGRLSTRGAAEATVE